MVLNTGLLAWSQTSTFISTCTVEKDAVLFFYHLNADMNNWLRIPEITLENSWMEQSLKLLNYALVVSYQMHSRKPAFAELKNVCTHTVLPYCDMYASAI